MTNFNDWYNFNRPSFANTRNQFIDVLRKAYEAGAASQGKDLRDKFAGQAMSAAIRREEQMHDTANFAYEQADAMLEARKVTGEGMTALQELLAKVEAGVKYETMGHTLLCQKAFPKPQDFDGSREAYANSNAQLAVLAWRNGSLNAAKALHEAVLPEWGRSVDATAPEMGIEVKLHSAESVSIGDHQPTEARAWLIAIIKAIIAQENAK
jgi:hypothetical protein